MKKIAFFSFAMVTIGLITNSCTYHNEDDYFKENQSICDTKNLSFSTDILPLLQNSCVSCHNSANQPNGVNLEDYANVSIQAKSGKLVSSIKHESGTSPMPAYQPMLDDCTIAKIETWVNDGFKNN